MAKKRKPRDPEAIDSIRYARSLVRKALAEIGVDDPGAHVREVLKRVRVEVAQRHAEST
jgi:hypothetical protein